MENRKAKKRSKKERQATTPTRTRPSEETKKKISSTIQPLLLLI
jgi:hypothetical protein